VKGITLVSLIAILAIPCTAAPYQYKSVTVQSFAQAVDQLVDKKDSRIDELKRANELYRIKNKALDENARVNLLNAGQLAISVRDLQVELKDAKNPNGNCVRKVEADAYHRGATKGMISGVVIASILWCFILAAVLRSRRSSSS
jgi:hypothetical protein